MAYPELEMSNPQPFISQKALANALKPVKNTLYRIQPALTDWTLRETTQLHRSILAITTAMYSGIFYSFSSDKRC